MIMKIWIQICFPMRMRKQIIQIPSYSARGIKSYFLDIPRSVFDAFWALLSQMIFHFYRSWASSRLNVEIFAIVLWCIHCVEERENTSSLFRLAGRQTPWCIWHLLLPPDLFAIDLHFVFVFLFVFVFATKCITELVSWSIRQNSDLSFDKYFGCE